jgi:hypothetical protein
LLVCCVLVLCRKFDKSPTPFFKNLPLLIGGDGK